MNQKIVLITGASSGIGKAAVVYLTNKGHKVYGTSRKSGGVKEGFTMLQADVTQPAAIEAAIHTIIKENGRIDVLVNNAGLGIAAPMEETPIADIEQVFETNVFGLIRMCQRILPHMRKQKSGKIINISSIGSAMGLPYRGIYSATKCSVDRITEALRMEMKPFGIDVCAILPGDVKTNINNNRVMPLPDHQSPYQESFGRCHQLMDRGVDMGLPPETFGKVLDKIIQAKKVRSQYIVGSTVQKASIPLKQLLPTRWFEYIIMKYYQV